MFHKQKRKKKGEWKTCTLKCKTLCSHLNSSLLVGLLLHLQLNSEDFGLPSSLASSPSLGQGC